VPELQALTLALQRLRHILDAQASEHLKLCSWLYLTYETEYDDYVIKHYSISNISDERLLDKLKRACKSFLTSRAGLAPRERWPEFYQAVEIPNALCEADAWAPPEPIQPKPITSSALSVGVPVILTDKQPEVFKASPMPEHETAVKRLSTSSRAPQSQLSPRTALTAAAVCSKQPPLAHRKAQLPLIPSSLAQESNEYKCERTLHPQAKPKEPNKAPGIRLRELSLSKSIEIRSFARSSVGSAPRVRPILSDSPPSDRDKQQSSIKIVSRTAETRASWDSPCTKAAPTLLKVMPAYPSQVPSIHPSMKVVPRRWDTKLVVVRKPNEPNVSQLLPTFETAPTLSGPLLPTLLLILKSLALLEEDGKDSEMEERQPVDVAVSKDNASIARCSPMFHTAPALPKSKLASVIQPDTSVPGGNVPKPARPIPAAPSAHHRSKSLTPEVWDTMPRTSYPDVASHNNLSSLPLSTKMDAYK
jgi:hypothetical protein